MTIETYYFQFHPTENAISLFSDKAERTGGMLQAGEGAHGVGFDDFKKAVAGKIIRSGNTFIVKPANPSQSPVPAVA